MPPYLLLPSGQCVFYININNMRICAGKFFEEDTTEYIDVRTAYFDKSECLEHANNR